MLYNDFHNCFQDFSLLGTWNFTTMLINNNVLQYHGTLLSENLSVYLSSYLRGDVTLWCFLFCFFLFKYKECINSKHPLFVQHGTCVLHCANKGKVSLSCCSQELEWALSTFLPAFGESKSEGISQHAKAFHRLFGGKDHNFNFLHWFNIFHIIGEAK